VLTSDSRSRQRVGWGLADNASARGEVFSALEGNGSMDSVGKYSDSDGMNQRHVH